MYGTSHFCWVQPICLLHRGTICICQFVLRFAKFSKHSNKRANVLLLHPLSYDFFRLSLAINVGGVDEVRSELHESVQDLNAGFSVRANGIPKLWNVKEDYLNRNKIHSWHTYTFISYDEQNRVFQ